MVNIKQLVMFIRVSQIPKTVWKLHNCLRFFFQNKFFRIILSGNNLILRFQCNSWSSLFMFQHFDCEWKSVGAYISCSTGFGRKTFFLLWQYTVEYTLVFLPLFHNLWIKGMCADSAGSRMWDERCTQHLLVQSVSFNHTQGINILNSIRGELLSAWSRAGL